MICKTYNINELKEYKYVVVLSTYHEKILLSRHKERTTWETQGGHIEEGETPLEAAKRELYEESGAVKYSIEPLCDYWAGDETTHQGAGGMVFTAVIDELGPMPESEMAEVREFDELPQNITYPAITPVVFGRKKQKELGARVRELKNSLCGGRMMHMSDKQKISLNDIERLGPMEIERRSFEIITEESAGRIPDDERAMIIKRVVHTAADFDYIDNLCFSDNAVLRAQEALRNGAWIVTDTTMALSGINKKSLKLAGGEAHCFIGDEDVAEEAKRLGVTRASVCVDKAARLGRPLIYAVGNAPTALIRLYELIGQGVFRPELIIGVPVGFVNVVQSKELIMQTDVPYIVARGRKGGSNVAAAICNALLYQLDGSRK